MSVATICVHGDSPTIERSDIVRSRKVLKAEPGLLDTIPVQLTSTSRQLTGGSTSVPRTSTSPPCGPSPTLTVDWTDAAITGHIGTGDPSPGTSPRCIGATCSLADDLAALPATVLR